MGVTDDMRQHPADAVFGDEAAPRERRCEDGVIGGETDVAIQRVHKADARGSALEHGDIRLADRGIKAVARLPVGPPVHVERRHALRASDVIRIEALQRVHVGTGAERASRASQNDEVRAIAAWLATQK